MPFVALSLRAVWSLAVNVTVRVSVDGLSEVLAYVTSRRTAS